MKLENLRNLYLGIFTWEPFLGNLGAHWHDPPPKTGVHSHCLPAYAGVPVLLNELYWHCSPWEGWEIGNLTNLYEPCKPCQLGKPLLGNLEPLLGNFGNLYLGTWEPLLGNLGKLHLGTLGTFTWEPREPWQPLLANLENVGNLYLGTLGTLGTFTWERWELLGTFSWEPWKPAEFWIFSWEPWTWEPWNENLGNLDNLGNLYLGMLELWGWGRGCRRENADNWHTLLLHLSSESVSLESSGDYGAGSIDQSPFEFFLRSMNGYRMWLVLVWSVWLVWALIFRVFWAALVWPCFWLSWVPNDFGSSPWSQVYEDWRLRQCTVMFETKFLLVNSKMFECVWNFLLYFDNLLPNLLGLDDYVRVSCFVFDGRAMKVKRPFLSGISTARAARGSLFSRHPKFCRKKSNKEGCDQ